MRNAPLFALDRFAQAVFNHLTQQLHVGGQRRFDQSLGLFMAVSVERLSARHFSIAHYFEQNGDLLADPDMTFFKTPGGCILPCSFQQDSLALYRIGLAIADDGSIEAHDRQQQHQQADFANRWLRNIAEQQRLPLSFTEEAEPCHAPTT